MTFIYQGSFHINYYSRDKQHVACHPILLKSTVFVDQIHLAAYEYGLLDAACTQSTKSVFPRLPRIPWVFHVKRNPWVLQVFQVCGHPDPASIDSSTDIQNSVMLS